MRELDELFDAQGGVATTGQLRQLLTRRELESLARRGELVRVWAGIWGRDDPGPLLRLRGLDLRTNEHVAMCLGTAALAYGFDTEDTLDLHVLNPDTGQLRESDGLSVHRREGAPLQVVDGRLANRSGMDGCRGRARTAASPSTGHPRSGMAHRRVRSAPIGSRCHSASRPARDRACTGLRSSATGFEFHSSPDDLRKDRQKRAALSHLDWLLTGIVADDVRRRPYEMTSGIDFELRRREAA